MPEENENIETEAPETEIIPVQDIFQLIEAQVADQVGRIEVEREEQAEDFITAETLQSIIEEKEVAIVANLAGVDEAALETKIGDLEDKLKEEAGEKFTQVEQVLAKTGQALGQLEEAGLSKISEVEGKVAQALQLGISKIAKSEEKLKSKLTEDYQTEIDKAKEDGKAFLAYQFEQFQSKITELIDERIRIALAEKEK